MKSLLTGALFGIFIIALVLTANIERVPVYNCRCRIDKGFQKQGRRLVPVVERDTITANDFWYEREKFVYVHNGDTIKRRNTYAVCTDFWNRDILPTRR